MKILSVRFPYGWAIVRAGKTPENRPKSTPYRGTVGIQQGLIEYDGWWLDRNISRAQRDQARDPSRSFPDPLWTARGAVIGLAELTDCHRADNGGDPAVGCGQPSCARWGDPDSGWHWILADPRPLDKPFPWRGALWLQDVSTVDEAEIRRRAA